MLPLRKINPPHTDLRLLVGQYNWNRLKFSTIKIEATVGSGLK